MARSNPQPADDDTDHEPTYTPPNHRAMALAEHSGPVDPSDPPAATPVRLIASVGTSDEPQVLAGRTSGTGKTLTISRNGGPIHRLRAARLFSGDTITRDGYWYELYTPEQYRRRFLEALGREPTPPLPAPTHQPAGDADGGQP